MDIVVQLAQRIKDKEQAERNLQAHIQENLIQLASLGFVKISIDYTRLMRAGYLEEKNDKRLRER